MATLKYVQNNGDTVTWTLKVTNTSNVTCHGTQVAFTIPTGVSLSGPLGSNGISISVPVGSYNPTSKIWFIGDLAANSSTPSVDWEFTVDDISQASALDSSFIVTALVSSRCDDEDETNNDFELMIKVGEECYDISITVGATSGTIVDPSNIQIIV